MLPLLRLLADGKEHLNRDLALRIAEELNLTSEERNAMQPGNKSTYLRNRIAWAGIYLRKAGLAESTKESTLKITQDGMNLLKNPPPKLSRQALMQFPPFRDYLDAQKKQLTIARSRVAVAAPTPDEEEESTPEERIEAAFLQLRETLVADLLARLAITDPFRFEQVVLDLLVAMGYGGSRREAAAVTQKTGDEGIDGVINEDRLGLDVIYVQAKRWTSNVGRPEIQGFVGALAGKRANKGIFITTSEFHENATEYANALPTKVILIGGRRLAELMIEHGIGVAEEHAYSMKKIDSDYFEET
jgi:restriction system protein